MASRTESYSSGSSLSLFGIIQTTMKAQPNMVMDVRMGNIVYRARKYIPPLFAPLSASFCAMPSSLPK
ncbi:MAG: hypothetical protein ACMUIU_09115 [bacterium]